MDESGAEEIDALIDAGAFDRAVAALVTRAVEAPQLAEPARRLGALLATMGRMTEARVALQRALAADENDLGALWGLYEIEQILGRPDAAVAAQRRAIAIAPVLSVKSAVHTPYGERRDGPRRGVLMVCVSGTFQANTPLEFIVDGEAAELHKWYLDGGDAIELPPYDLIFNAVGHAPDLAPIYERIETFAASQPCALINRPERVAALARETLAQTFADMDGVVVTQARIVGREALAAQGLDEPSVVRPVGSQAGNDLARIETATELEAYLETTPDATEFYCAPFIDYRSADGYFRKYRILFVDGVAYPVHLAISPNWMVHYYNAPMAENAWMRSEEEAFMRDIDAVFHGRAAEGLREIGRRLELEYVAIDCSIDHDGRVVLFEADTAMLVHLADPIDLYPYKHAYIPRIIAAITRLFDRVAIDERPSAYIA